MGNNPVMDSPKDDIVGVPAAARVMGISQQSVRNHLRAGTLKATKAPGKYGPVWRFRPTILAAFVSERYGRDLVLDEVAVPSTASDPPEVADLYERIVELTEEATRFRTLAEISESTKAQSESEYKAMIAELQHENDKLRELAGRSWIRRLFGG